MKGRRVGIAGIAAIGDHFSMFFESAHLRAAVEFGIATLWLGFPGEPVNALDAARLRELDAALAALEANSSLRIVVVRSAKPAGFCAGIHPNAWAGLGTAADRAAFAWLGQSVFARLANLRATTVAFLDGPCLGAGLELALACDHRLALARLDTHLGFPDRLAGFGGTGRLRQRLGRRRARQLLESGRTLSGREAQALGLVDRAFCERRAKIELRTFLDGLERSPLAKKLVEEPAGLAEERRAFARLTKPPIALTAIREAMDPAIALARGFITPLEAELLQWKAMPAPAIPVLRELVAAA